MGTERAAARCLDCMSFVADPRRIERGMAGLSSLGSAHGSSRGDDGFCVFHDRYVTAWARCPRFRASPPGPERPG